MVIIICNKRRYYFYSKRFTGFTSDTYWRHISKLTHCILIILIPFLIPLFRYSIIPLFYYSIILLIYYFEVTPLAVPRLGTTDGTSASSTQHRRYLAAVPSPTIAITTASQPHLHVTAALSSITSLPPCHYTFITVIFDI